MMEESEQDYPEVYVELEEPIECPSIEPLKEIVKKKKRIKKGTRINNKILAVKK